MLNNPRTLKTIVITGLVAVIGVALFLRLSSLRDVLRPTDIKGKNEDPLDKARALLRRASDIGTCRAALQQVNTKLNQKQDIELPKLSDGARDDLRQRLGLTASELDEIEHARFTLLDGMHLEKAILFRDAASSVAPQLEAPAVRTPEQQAEALFGWVVRQIQLEDDKDMEGDRPMVAPHLSLRRGVGPPLARALVFLGLCDQLNLHACLLAYPSPRSATWRYWACGVLGSGNRIYLFEPRLGLPLPAADGGIATLDELRKGEAALRLDAGPGQRLIPPQETVAASEVHLAVPLSALAPRLGYLEKEVLPRVKPVRLTPDPQASERFQAALKAAGHPEVIKLAPWAARLERQFLPEDEGGVNRTDRPFKQEEREEELWAAKYKGFRIEPGFSYLQPLVAGLPEKVRPRRVSDLSERPLNRIFDGYAHRFFEFFQSPGQPRDQVLRADFSEATRALSPLDGKLQLTYDFYRQNFDSQKVSEWVEEAQFALARDLPAPTGGDSYAMVRLLEAGASAEALLPEVRYLLALVKHEQAERVLYRLGPPSALKQSEQVRELDRTWREAQTLWDTFLATTDPRPSEPLLLQAKALRARGQQVLAELALLRARQAPPAERPALEEQARTAIQTARDYWQDLAANRKDSAAVGFRFLVRELERKVESRK